MKFKMIKDDIRECKGLFFQHWRARYGGIKEADFFVGAFLKDKLIACIAIRQYSYDVFHFGLTVVHPDHRRKGVCTELLNNTITILQEMGARTIRNSKDNSTFPFEWFYDNGFKLIDTFKDGKRKVRVLELIV